jgi:hypothetical protein
MQFLQSVDSKNRKWVQFIFDKNSTKLKSGLSTQCSTKNGIFAKNSL